MLETVSFMLGSIFLALNILVSIAFFKTSKESNINVFLGLAFIAQAVWILGKLLN